MNYQFLLFLFYLIHPQLCQVLDYWSENFDENKNCENEDLIQKFIKEENPSRCAKKKIGDDSIQWEECKKDLASKLGQHCGILNIEKTGDLLYCKNRGQTSCCFHNESCSETYEAVHDRLKSQSMKFLKDPKKFLADMVANLNYDTCHAISKNDATKCAEDCKKLEKEDFAKECTKNGNLYKCCIRRDKEFCHECRFCCTLSVCTSPDGTIYKDSKNITKSKNKHQQVTSKMGFTIDYKMWKSYDYRCLKPKENIKPEKWSYYEMNGYRSAKTKQELENVEEIKFDKYFFNFEDPKVFRRMMKGTNREKIWKRTFGFDFVYFNDKENSSNMQLPCYIDCLKAEQKKFARYCKKKGGLFKCCMSSLGLDKFESVRNFLKQKQLIHGVESNICKPNGPFSHCVLCAITQVCAVKDPMTGTIEETFKTPYTNLQHKIGGRGSGHGLKYFGCHVQDTCKDDTINGGTDNYEPHVDFQRASTQEEFCNLTQLHDKAIQKREEPFQTHYYKECIKQDSPNVFLCPDKKYLRHQSNKTVYVNKVLLRLKRYMRKKLKKKKKKSAKSRKRKKERKSSKKKTGKNHKKSIEEKERKRKVKYRKHIKQPKKSRKKRKMRRKGKKT